MGDSPFACPDTRHAVAEHEASGRQVGADGRRAVPRRSRTGLGAGRFKPGGLSAPIGRARIRLVGPVAVRVEVLRPVQGSTETLQGLALGALFGLASNPQSVSRFTSAPTIWPLVVEQTPARRSPRRSDRADGRHNREARGGLVARVRIAAVEKSASSQCAAGSDISVRSGAPTAPNFFPWPASWSTDLGSKQSPSEPVPAGQATAARVIRSCSRFCPRRRSSRTRRPGPEPTQRTGPATSVASRRTPVEPLAEHAPRLAGRRHGRVAGGEDRAALWMVVPAVHDQAR